MDKMIFCSFIIIIGMAILLIIGYVDIMNALQELKEIEERIENGNAPECRKYDSNR